MRAVRYAAAVVAACAGVAGTGAAPAVAKPQKAKTKTRTVVMYFFAKRVYTRLSDPGGRRLGSSFAPAVGDRVSYASEDYAGDHNRHAKRAIASDSTVCTVTSPTSVLCDGSIAIGGSLIIADDYVLTFPAKSRTTTIRITGGTGRYRGAGGTISATVVGNNVDVTVKVKIKQARPRIKRSS